MIVKVALVGTLIAAFGLRAMNAYAKAEETETPAEITDLNLDKSDGVRLTLEESVRMAIEAATSVLKSKSALDVSGATLLQSYMQFLPNLTAQASTGRYRGTEYLTTAAPTMVNGAGATAGYGINTTLNLFNGLSDLAQFKAANLRQEASQFDLHRAKQAISLDVTQSFLTVNLDNQLVEIARKNLQESQARERLLTEQTRVGAKNLADLFRQKAQTSTDEALLLTTENKRRADQIFLLQKLRVDVTKSYHFVDFKLPDHKSLEHPVNEDSLLQAGLANRVDLKSTNALAGAANWDIKKQRATYFPRLDFQAGMNSAGGYLYNQTVNGASVVPPTQTPLDSQLRSQIEYSLGLVLTWTIFDRLVTHQAVVQAQARASDAQIDASDLRNQVLADVRLGFSNYKTAIQQLRTSKQGLAAAEKAFAVIEGRYEVGSANFIDLVTAQATLLQAESVQAQALTNFILQGKALEFATGEMPVGN